MAIWKRLSTNKADKEVFHSSGMVAGDDAKTIGTTSTETFEKRRAIDRNRQVVGKYRDAGVVHTYKMEHKHIARSTVTSVESASKNSTEPESRHTKTPQRIDVVRARHHRKLHATTPKASEPTAQAPAYSRRQISDIRRPGAAKKPVVKPSFTEPASRKYNPYQ